MIYPSINYYLLSIYYMPCSLLVVLSILFLLSFRLFSFRVSTHTLHDRHPVMSVTSKACSAHSYFNSFPILFLCQECLLPLICLVQYINNIANFQNHMGNLKYMYISGTQPQWFEFSSSPVGPTNFVFIKDSQGIEIIRVILKHLTNYHLFL